jgi:hypothetical protein
MSETNRMTDFRRLFMGTWGTVFGLTVISKVDESDDPNDTLDMAGDGSQANPLPRFEPYGVMHNPPAKTSALYWKMGDGGAQMPWGTSYQGRPKGTKAGDVALYVDVQQMTGGASVRVFLHGSQSGTPGQIDILGKSGAKVVIDKDGEVTVIPAAGKKVKLGDGTDANLEAVVLQAKLTARFDEFVSFYNNHRHTETGVTTEKPDILAGNLGNVSSVNVVAKK